MLMAKQKLVTDHETLRRWYLGWPEPGAAAQASALAVAGPRGKKVLSGKFCKEKGSR
jgi:hypothetical protein